MIRLLFIVPYPELEERVKAVLEMHPEKDRIAADVQVLTVDETPLIHVAEYDAVIARGYSALQLKTMYPQIPIIKLSMSGYDVIRTISECKKKFQSKKIAICGFFGKLYEVDTISQLLDCEVEIFTPEHYQDLEETICLAIQMGCDAVVGGYTASMSAQKHQIPFCMISTGEDTIFQALNEAVQTVEEIQKERLVSEMYKTIIYASKDGILFVDAQGMIQVRNHVVRAMNDNVSLLHRPLRECLPFLYRTFQEVLKSGQEVSGLIHEFSDTHITVSAALTPVIVNQMISGVVITLMDITHIQKLEKQIRSRLSEKGLRAKYTFADIIHESGVIENTIDQARKYAMSESNIIIVGETGTGKELFAQSIHNGSTRKNGPFVAINCAALPENLLESELFGYVEGAFTGTVRGGKMGLFEQAHGGTLFLDEIGEISLSTQTKLLRVLQEREVRRIGDNKVISVDVRIISATNRSITQLTEQGKFRKDLAYRLDVLRIFLPPLRQRGSDVELLFLHLLKQQIRANNRPFPEIDMSSLSVLHDYPFTGNIRELRNIAERASVLCSQGVITRECLLQALYPPDLDTDIPAAPLHAKHGNSEKEMIFWALEECGGNQSKAAKLLGIDRSTLWRKLKKYSSK
ncbi:MAG: sigma 54-interacting transcriptional regulator [Lachnospiraceae bacterium]|nr:sigma 54-interacting transcriptional regulator [Lachnospiraceae bacterium]